IRRDRAQRLNPRHFVPGEVLQDVMLSHVLVAGMADAEAHAAIFVADMRRDRTQAVVAGIAATGFYPQLARRQIEFVVENDDVRFSELVEMRGFRHRAAGLVHVGTGQQQQNTLAVDLAFHRHALETPAPRRNAMRARNRLYGHEADVMAVAGVALAWIAEADEEKHGSTTPPPAAEKSNLGGRARARLTSWR